MWKGQAGSTCVPPTGAAKSCFSQIYLRPSKTTLPPLTHPFLAVTQSTRQRFPAFCLHAHGPHSVPVCRARVRERGGCACLSSSTLSLHHQWLQPPVGAVPAGQPGLPWGCSRVLSTRPGARMPQMFPAPLLSAACPAGSAPPLTPPVETVPCGLTSRSSLCLPSACFFQGAVLTDVSDLPC